MKKLVVLSIVLLLSKLVLAQPDDAILAYIEKYKDIAVEEMKRTGVPAAITLAQGIHETSAGTSALVLKSNNHFGIKCKVEWKGESVNHDDDAPQECFRKYNDPLDSYRDHSDFLKNRPYYASLFKLDPMDYKAWAYGLKKAGYATNPRYPQILIKLIEEWDLQEFSYIAMGRAEEYYKDHPYLVNKDQRGQEPPAIKANETPVANVAAAPVVLTNGKTVELLKGRDKQSVAGGGTPIAIAFEKIESPKPSNTANTIATPAVSYPEGQFEINKTKVIYAKKGTSLLSIAEEYKLPLSWLIEFNDMVDADVLDKGQLIYLQRKRKVSDKEFHVMMEGETLYDVSQTEGIRLESLLELNLLNDERLQPAVGEKLMLNHKAAQRPLLVSEIIEAAKTVASNTNDKAIIHVVQPKEGLYSIAKKYGVTMEQIRKWNNLPDNNLRNGQELIINK
jgi:LysM repeat protein